MGLLPWATSLTLLVLPEGSDLAFLFDKQMITICFPWREEAVWLICGFKNLWPPSQIRNCTFFPWVYLSSRGTTKVKTCKTKPMSDVTRDKKNLFLIFHPWAILFLSLFFFWLCFKSSSLLSLQIQLSVTLTNFILTYYLPRTVLSAGCKIMNVYKNVCVFICREIHMCIYMVTCMNAHTHIS